MEELKLVRVMEFPVAVKLPGPTHRYPNAPGTGLTNRERVPPGQETGNPANVGVPKTLPQIRNGFISVIPQTPELSLARTYSVSKPKGRPTVGTDRSKLIVSALTKPGDTGIPNP